MFDLELEHNQENAELLLQGMWYSELPDILCMEERKVKTLNVLEYMSLICTPKVRRFLEVHIFYG